MRTSLLLVASLFTLAPGCGKDEPKASAKAEPAASGSKVEARPEPAPAPEPEPAKPAPADPATFTPIDVPLLGITVKAPPGATVTEDVDPFSKGPSKGVVIASGTFTLHVHLSFMGGERDRARMTASMTDGATFEETKHDPSLNEYTVEQDGVKRYGYFGPIDGYDDGMDDQLICGTASPVATYQELDAYRAACATVTINKK